MNYDTERATQKKDELVLVAEDALTECFQLADNVPDATSVATISKRIIDNFVQNTPPEMPRMEFITMSQGGYGGGTTTKPGNLVLNLRTLLVDLAEVITIGAGALNVHWLAPFVALRIWNKLWSRLNIKISEHEAVVLLTMWKNCDHNNYIPEDGVLDLVNTELGSNGRSSISRQELDDSLEILRRMKCIQRSTSIKNKWWLRESVSVPYR